MTFNECRDLVMLAVSGGLLSVESAVQRAEVEAYIPVAVQDVVAQDARERAVLNARLKSVGTIVSTPFSHFESISVALTKEGNYWVGEIDGAIIQGDSGLLIGPVTACGPSAPINYLPMKSQGEYTILAGLGIAAKAFWVVAADGKTKFYLTHAPTDCKVDISVSLLPSCGCGDKALPVSGALGKRVVDVCVQHFARQRSAPADARVTGNDLNAQ